LKLTLKIVADVALVGVPNAGKSTFLASVTRAKPKIANYPFTTVVPNLGVWVPPASDGYVSDSAEGGSGSAGLVLCDVPGLIAGAAEGVGLGHAFLRHVERCHVILHLVDATSADPIGDFDMLNREILRYGNGKLARMPQIVVVNKVDAWEEGKGEEWEQGLKARMGKGELEEKLRATMTHSRLMWMSAKEGEGVDDLMARMAMFVRKVKNASDES
jgi:GTP-binding protein